MDQESHMGQMGSQVRQQRRDASYFGRHSPAVCAPHDYSRRHAGNAAEAQHHTRLESNFAESSSDTDRGTFHEKPVSVRAGESGYESALQVRADHGTEDEAVAGADGRDYRLADQESANQREYRSRQSADARRQPATN